MSDNQSSTGAESKREDARVKETGQFGADKKYVGEGRGAHIDAGSAWDTLEAGDSIEFDNAEVNVRGFDGITLHRTSTETDMDNGTDSSLFVQAIRSVDLTATAEKLGLWVHDLPEYRDVIDQAIRDGYGDAYLLVDGWDDFNDCDVQFACDDDDLADGETFPNDVANLAAFVLDKTKIGQLRDDIDSGVFYENLAERIAAARATAGGSGAEARCWECGAEFDGPDVQQLLERHLSKEHPAMVSDGFGAGGHL